MTFEVVEIMYRERSAGHEKILLVGDSGNRQIAFDPAFAIEHLSVDNFADRLRDIAGANPVENVFRIRAGDNELGKRALVEDNHVLTAVSVLAPDVLKPVRTPEAVAVLGFYPRRGKPVGTLPAGLGAEARSVVLKTFVEGTAA